MLSYQGLLVLIVEVERLDWEGREWSMYLWKLGVLRSELDEDQAAILTSAITEEGSVLSNTNF